MFNNIIKFNSMKSIISKNPFTGQILQLFPLVTQQQLITQLDFAKEGYELHRKRTTKDKQSMIKDIASLLQKNKSKLANLITLETGKPIVESQFQIAQSLKICQYYSKQHAALVPLNIKTQAKRKTLIKYLPLGTILCFLPSNYPLLVHFYKILPQLLLGNGVLVKHSQYTSSIGKAIEKIMRKAGFQSGQYQQIWNSHEETELIIKNQQIAGVSFTGSTEQGSVVAALAGKYLKKYHLTLTFHSTMILLQDGNVQTAVQNAIKMGYFHSGQGITPKLLIVHRSNYQKFKLLLIERLKSLKFGDPTQQNVQIGPIQKLSLCQKLKRQLSSLPESSKIIYERSEMTLPFYPLTVIECQKQMVNKLHEGPIFQLFQADNDKHCIELANKMLNNSVSFVFSSKNWQPLIDDLNTGSTFVNNVCYFDPHVPLGHNTYSRDGWYEGIRSFANIKTNFIN